MKFKCDCQTHILEITYTKLSKKYPFVDLSLAIYDIYNPNSGRKYKKPKLVADVIIMNNHYPKELTKLLKWFSVNLDKMKRR